MPFIQSVHKYLLSTYDTLDVFIAGNTEGKKTKVLFSRHSDDRKGPGGREAVLDGIVKAVIHQGAAWDLDNERTILE